MYGLTPDEIEHGPKILQPPYRLRTNRRELPLRCDVDPVMRSALATCLVLAACAQRQQRPPILPVRAPLAVTTAAATGRPPPTGDSCSLHADHLYPPRDVALVTPSGRSFGAFKTADDVTVTATGSGAHLEITLYGMMLRTLPGGLPVYTTQKMTLGAFRPSGDTPLAWSTLLLPSTVSVSPPSDPRVEWAAQPPDESVPCAALSLTPGADLTETSGDQDYVIDARQAVALSSRPGGEPVVRVTTGGDVGVVLLQKQGSFAEIRVALDGGVYDGGSVTGWVDAPLVHEGALTISEMGMGIGGIAGSSEWGGCPEDRPLFVDAGGGPELVGDVLEGTRVEPLGATGPYVRVRMLGPSVREVPAPVTFKRGVELLMRRADAASCR
jgi:hypothetical protein